MTQPVFSMLGIHAAVAAVRCGAVRVNVASLADLQEAKGNSTAILGTLFGAAVSLGLGSSPAAGLLSFLLVFMMIPALIRRFAAEGAILWSG